MRHEPNGNLVGRSRRSQAPFVVLAISICVIAGVLVEVAPASGATSGWSAVRSPRPTAYGRVYLNAVSCPSTNRCFAVGWADPPDGAIANALVEHWNGHTWSIMTTPKPAGSPGAAYLNAVTCVRTTSCFAVGYVQSGSSPIAFKTLVEHWNGRSWKIMRSPNPVGSGTPNSYLNGVSCWGAKNCFAVGNSTFHGQRTLVEHWNGNHWSIISSPNAPGSLDDVLNAVSCASRNSCFAVGFASGSASHGLVEHWNGNAWSIMTAPTPTGFGDYLSDVSCSSTASCVAVGGNLVGGVETSLTEHWNGRAWSIVTTPNPASGTSTFLNGVSCPTSTRCFAVGRISREVAGVGVVEKTRVEQWNGDTWSIVTSPNPGGARGFGTLGLNGVSCRHAASCFAVGEFGGSASQGGDGRRTLIERYR